MARLYREAPFNAIWEGSGKVMALDVLRVLRRDREQVQAVIDELGCSCGAPGKALAAAILQSLGDHDCESQARRIAEQLGRLGALAALHEANGTLAEAYAATRLQSAPHATFGACDLHNVKSLLLSRVLPPEFG